MSAIRICRKVFCMVVQGHQGSELYISSTLSRRAPYHRARVSSLQYAFHLKRASKNVISNRKSMKIISLYII